MLRLTKLTDYGILLMTHMASQQGELVSSQELAEITHVPGTTVSKLLQTLMGAGLLESVRGAHGGYRLARPPEHINVCEIIDCLEGRMALTECSLEDAHCEQWDVCTTGRSWRRLNQAVRQALSSISLADMAREDFTPVLQLRHGIRLTEVSS
ncbi:MAG: SUF system Fe-S cluster assembly regulator [Zetaproteobacteria bacterium]|nr:MAG: SUF system Fe-S cluster assembly regulator [Zetaproteobacteria bacterium]